MATIVSVFLADALIVNAKLVPLVPMVVGIASLSIILLFDKRNEENREWALSSWGFAKQILPLLAVGVVTAGFLLGSTHDDTSIAGVIPNEWIEWLSVEIRCYPTSSQVSREHSCILPP